MTKPTTDYEAAHLEDIRGAVRKYGRKRATCSVFLFAAIFLVCIELGWVRTIDNGFTWYDGAAILAFTCMSIRYRKEARSQEAHLLGRTQTK